MAVKCDRETPGCELPKSEAMISEALFCDRYVKLRHDLLEGDAKSAMLRMRETDMCPSHKDMK